jgi:L-cysteine/cystine lyase
MFDIARVRSEAPSVLTQTFLNAGTFGPVPTVSAEAMRARIDEAYLSGRNGSQGFRRWMDLLAEARREVALTLAVPEGEVALMHATTEGINTVLSGLRWAPGDRIVLTTSEHPGLTAPLDELRAHHDVDLVTVAPTLEAIAGALRTPARLLAVSHVLWNSGAVLPMAELSVLAHAAGAKVLVDGAQSVGAIAVRPADTGADFYTVSGQKWLCGPSGTGALWVRAQELPSLGTPWASYMSKNRFAGSTPVEWPDARRLDAQTMSLTSLAGFSAALRWQRANAEAGGYAHALGLANQARQALKALGAELASPDASSPIVSFAIPGADPTAVVRELEAASVIVRAIPGSPWVRTCFGMWNDASDVAKLCRVLGARGA